MKLMKIKILSAHLQQTRKNNSQIKILKINQNRNKKEKFLIYHMQNNSLNNRSNNKQNIKKIKKYNIKKKSNKKIKKKSSKTTKKMHQRHKLLEVLKITSKKSK